jgi:hypothetical protein
LGHIPTTINAANSAPPNQGRRLVQRRGAAPCGFFLLKAAGEGRGEFIEAIRDVLTLND